MQLCSIESDEDCGQGGPHYIQAPAILYSSQFKQGLFLQKICSNYNS
jgi:hypothetical protein